MNVGLRPRPLPVFGSANVRRDFASLKALAARRGPAVSFSRASSGTLFDATGALKTLTSNAARFDHVPVGGLSLGLLIEESREQRIIQSEDLTTTWSISRAVVVADQITAPDGALTADKVRMDATAANNHSVEQTDTGLTDNTVYTFTFFLNEAELNFALLQIRNKANTTPGSYFDLANGVLGTEGGTLDNRSIEDIGDGWYRCSVSLNMSTGVTTPDFRLFLAEADNDIIIDGDSVSGIYAWGGMLEEGSFPTSYVRTTTVAVTRAADVASAAVAPGSEFTWYISGRTARGAGTQVLAQIDDAGGTPQNNSVRFERNASNEIHLIVNDGGVAQADINIGTVADQTDFKVAARIKENDFRAALDGTLAALDSAGTVPSGLSTERIGQSDSGQQFNGWLADDAIWFGSRNDAFLEIATNG